MNKTKRQEKISQLLKTNSIGNQSVLIELLANQGIQTNQATISRDFAELGVFKKQGSYYLSQESAETEMFQSSFQCLKSGDSLLVIQTGKSIASYVASQIESLDMNGIVGMIAKQDTLFIAVKNKKAQQRLFLQLQKMLSSILS